MKKCFFVGIGAGVFSSLSIEAIKKIESAGLVAGSRRALDCILNDIVYGKIFCSYKSEEIAQEFEDFSHTSEMPCCAVFSGDISFFSGAEKLGAILESKGWQIERICGASSVQIFAAKLGKSWENWHFASAHGREINIPFEIAFSKYTFFLTGGKINAHIIAQTLAENRVHSFFFAGNDLGYANEKIVRFEIGEDGDFSIPDFYESNLCVVLVEKIDAQTRSFFDDADFLREDGVPMTKKFVRAAIVSILSPSDGDVIWDIGTGSGAVAVEIAKSGRVFVHSVEKNKAAFDLAAKNRIRFGALNLALHFGEASGVLRNLPAPNGVFVGGSSGNLSQIVSESLSKNPFAKIAVSCVTVETLCECKKIAQSHNLLFSAVLISVSQSAEVKNLNLLKAQNPVYLVSLSSKNGG